jgi:hypothetical protein
MWPPRLVGPESKVVSAVLTDVATDDLALPKPAVSIAEGINLERLSSTPAVRRNGRWRPQAALLAFVAATLLASEQPTASSFIEP